MNKKLEKIKTIVEKTLSCSAHDMAHVIRVYNLCLKLAKGKKIDTQVLEAAALLHDIARVKEDNNKTGKIDHAKENTGGKINGRVRDKTKHSTQIEYETKYKFLCEKIFTPEAKKICKKRTKFFKNFLDVLEKEINY